LRYHRRLISNKGWNEYVPLGTYRTHALGEHDAQRARAQRAERAGLARPGVGTRSLARTIRWGGSTTAREWWLNFLGQLSAGTAHGRPPMNADCTAEDLRPGDLAALLCHPATKAL